MPSQSDKATLFRDLHKKRTPVILFNIWDVGSANAVIRAGAQALATGSASVAMANGYADGEHIPLDIVLESIKRIVDAVELPVSLDFEGAYAVSPDDVERNVTRAMEAGIVGINFEDQILGGTGLYTTADQSDRLAAARSAMNFNGVSGFLNARTDIFLKAKPAEHSDAMVEEAIARASAYQQAGADGYFVPGVANEDHIKKICDSIAMPVNIIALPHVPEKARLVELGASRISYGPVPYRQMIQFVEDQAKGVI